MELYFCPNSQVVSEGGLERTVVVLLMLCSGVRAQTLTSTTSSCGGLVWRLKMSLPTSIAIAGLVCFATSVSPQPNKLYELQERCGKRAAEVFAQEYSPPVLDTKDGQTRFNYENNYSARLNSCFFLEIAVSYDKGKSSRSKIMRLFDLNGNKEYGTFVSGPTESMPLACVVRGKGCQSESEWRELVKPFMED
jgi:hypothetical protein